MSWIIHLNYWLNIIPNSIFHMGKMTRARLLPTYIAFVLNNVWRLAPGTQQSGSAAALALAVTLLVVTLYLVEQRCRGVICPSELLGSQNRIRALWKKPSHSALGGLLPCLQARQCLDLGLESPLSAQAFFGELHHKDNNPFNNAQGGHSQHNTTRGKKRMFIQLSAHWAAALPSTWLFWNWIYVHAWITGDLENVYLKD